MGRLAEFGEHIHGLTPFAVAGLCGLRLSPSLTPAPVHAASQELPWDPTAPVRLQRAEVALQIARWALPAADGDGDEVCELAHFLFAQ